MAHLDCGLVSTLQWVGAASAGLAALFWFISACTKFGRTLADHDTLPDRLNRQSNWSALAAVFAAVAAAIQAVLVKASTCINLH